MLYHGCQSPANNGKGGRSRGKGKEEGPVLSFYFGLPSYYKALVPRVAVLKRGEWPSGLYSLRQVTEVKLGRVRSDFGWVTTEA